MRDSGDGEAPGDDSDGRLDLSRDAVNRRLSAFVSEHKAALAAGDPRARRESDRLLAAWAQEALAYQEKAALDQAEAQAKVERSEYEQRGGRVQ